MESIKENVVSSFNENGLAKVEIGEKVGLINYAGEEVLALKYEDIKILLNHFILIKKEGQSWDYFIKLQDTNKKYFLPQFLKKVSLN